MFVKSKHIEDEVTLQIVLKKEMSLNHRTFYIQSVVIGSLEKYLCSLKDSVTTVRTCGQQSCYTNPSYRLSHHNVHTAFCSEAKGGRDLKPGRFSCVKGGIHFTVRLPVVFIRQVPNITGLTVAIQRPFPQF